MVLADLNFKAVNLEYFEGMSGSDVACGLLSLHSNVSPLTLVIAYAGTGLRGNVNHLETREGKLHFQDTHFLSLETDKQQRNLIEMYIRLVKRLMRSTLNSKGDHRIPRLTYTQLSYPFQKICQEVNCITHQKGDYLTDLSLTDFFRPL